MSQTPVTAVQDRLGPVDLLVIEFPRGEIRAEGFQILVNLVEREIIRVLDLEFVRRDADGTVSIIDVTDAVADATEDLGFLVGASSGLLDPEDVAYVGGVIGDGSIAGVLVYENIWIMPMAAAVEAGGARIVTAAHVDVEDLVASLGDDD